MTTAHAKTLTEKKYWDEIWSKCTLPIQIKRNDCNSTIIAQLDIFDRYLHNLSKKASILEIGGAPGQYLGYLLQHYNLSGSAIDYSDSGCECMHKNFQMLGINVTIYKNDILDDHLVLPKFDIVYSLGVIEHFPNLGEIVKRHIEFLNPGGLLIIGVPNFIRVYSPLLKKTAPKTIFMHNLDTLNLDNWKCFEDENLLEVKFKGYIGGFEPGYIHSVIKNEQFGKENRIVKIISGIFFLLARLKYRLSKYVPSTLMKYNSKFWSAYGIAVYKKPLFNNASINDHN